jgi:hypothetical protein
MSAATRESYRDAVARLHVPDDLYGPFGLPELKENPEERVDAKVLCNFYYNMIHSDEELYDLVRLLGIPHNFEDHTLVEHYVSYRVPVNKENGEEVLIDVLDSFDCFNNWAWAASILEHLAYAWYTFVTVRNPRSNIYYVFGHFLCNIVSELMRMPANCVSKTYVYVLSQLITYVDPWITVDTWERMIRDSEKGLCIRIVNPEMVRNAVITSHPISWSLNRLSEFASPGSGTILNYFLPGTHFLAHRMLFMSTVIFFEELKAGTNPDRKDYSIPHHENAVRGFTSTLGFLLDPKFDTTLFRRIMLNYKRDFHSTQALELLIEQYHKILRSPLLKPYELYLSFSGMFTINLSEWIKDIETKVLVGILHSIMFNFSTPVFMLTQFLVTYRGGYFMLRRGVFSDYFAEITQNNDVAYTLHESEFGGYEMMHITMLMTLLEEITTFVGVFEQLCAALPGIPPPDQYDPYGYAILNKLAFLVHAIGIGDINVQEVPFVPEIWTTQQYGDFVMYRPQGKCPCYRPCDDQAVSLSYDEHGNAYPYITPYVCFLIDNLLRAVGITQLKTFSFLADDRFAQVEKVGLNSMRKRLYRHAMYQIAFMFLPYFRYIAHGCDLCPRNKYTEDEEREYRRRVAEIEHRSNTDVHGEAPLDQAGGDLEENDIPAEILGVVGQQRMIPEIVSINANNAFQSYERLIDNQQPPQHT